MTDRYRVDCLNPACRWVGYRRNAYECECYDYPCHPTSPGMGCPNGASLRASCPRCKGDWEPRGLKTFGGPEYFVARATWSRREVSQIFAGRAKLRSEGKR
ncbi:hypothetical protein [Streptomyces sp. NRRL S-920]|uniref:hypothetical protein n=1 Tax=Streptomyces sp. NRRL S-920 TaxID=1463921 RepID=UPI0004CC0B5D|nr:hypothetical protein [Streptomyces sp. NRRL S-920]